jgi:putative ABC transport system ATP-binding protein
VLEIRNLVKAYQGGGGERVRAVDGVSMTVAAGELAVLYGPSGSGKTTLLELIAGLRPADSGSVLLDGRDVFALSPTQSDRYRLSDVGIIGQPQNLTPGWRAIETASLKLWLAAPRADVRSRIEPLLEQLGLAERMFNRTEELSMGERQRLLIAQALSTDPKLVLADEPTGSLDSQRTGEVLALLRDLATSSGKAILLATHDPLAAAYADQVYELRDGRLQSYEPEQLRAGPGSVASSF